jgi:hypothetical protein
MHRNLDTYHPVFGIDAANRGRQPTTLVEAGFIPCASKYTIETKTGTELQVNMPIRVDAGELKLVQPGGIARYRLIFDGVPALLHVDEPLRAYVVDSHGRTTYGGASPMFRRMMQSGWKPPPETDPRALEKPEDAPWVPKPVYPRWQLWKPRHLRVRLHGDPDTVAR